MTPTGPVNLTAALEGQVDVALRDGDGTTVVLRRGDRHDGEVPGHVDSTTGHDLA